MRNVDMVFGDTGVADHSLKETLSAGDINWMLLAHGDRIGYLNERVMLSPAFFVPDEYENTKQGLDASVVGRKRDFDEGMVNIPVHSPRPTRECEPI